MNFDPGDSQIHILLIDIDILSYILSPPLSHSHSLFLSFPLFYFSHKPNEVDERSEELNSDQECVLTE